MAGEPRAQYLWVRMGKHGEDERWQAVQARDAGSDGRFVYAVDSTGVYCRPSCPSRRPRRERVRFFASVAAAERAGYRACLRCRPREQPAWAERLRLACARLEQDPPPTLAALGRELGVSPHHLQRTFKRILGISPRE